MKILCLTTNTPHHNFFVRQIMNNCTEVSVIYETTSVVSPYPTHHSFEVKRDQYERENWGHDCSEIDDKEIAYLDCVNNINQMALNNKFELQADLCIVFGTRKIQKKTIALLPTVTVNLHGGDPELYRGLDSHLWSQWIT